MTFLFYGCSSDEPLSSEEYSVPSDNIYLEFNQWVYSQMNGQYLWREDMPDSTECNYDLTPKEFFQSLLSSKDRFSYFTDNPSYIGSRANNPGFAYQEIKDKNNHKALCVLYVTSKSAKDAGLRRGDLVEIMSSDTYHICLKRLNVKNGILSDDYECLEYSIDNIIGHKNSVLLDSVYNINGRKIGYLCYLEFERAGDLEIPLKKFRDDKISELILDLRYNPGGYVSTCQFLTNCIVPQSAYGEIFQQCSYNDILSNYYLHKDGNERTFTYFDFPFPSDKEVLGLSIIGLQLEKIYVLTSKHTASASEATIICLQPYMEVITIGEKTVGKGVGSWNISDPKYQYSIQPITMRYYNADGESTPDDGITPDYLIPDGYSTTKNEIGDIKEPLLSTALALINVSCIETTFSLAARSTNIDKSLTPVGEPSYVTEFNNKHYNESN